MSSWDRLGELSFNLVGTYLDELTYVSGVPGVAPTECEGKYSGALCGVPNPDWRHHFRIGWETPWNVDVSLTWRYYAERDEHRCRDTAPTSTTSSVRAATSTSRRTGP